MGNGGGPLSLLMRIHADPSAAQDALDSFKDKVGATTSAIGGNFQGLNSILESTLGSFSGFATLGIGAVTAVGGALFGLAEKFANTAQQINQMSIMTGISAGNLSVLRLASDEAGVSFEGATRGLIMFSRNIAMAQRGSKLQVDAFKDLGISLKDNEKHWRSADDILPEVTEKLGKMEAGSRRTADTAALFGARLGLMLLPAMQLVGREGFERVREEAQKLGLYFDKQGIADANTFKVGISELQEQFEGLELGLGKRLLPAFTELAAVLLNVHPINAWIDAFTLLSTPIRLVVEDVMALYDAFKAVYDASHFDFSAAGTDMKEAWEHFKEPLTSNIGALKDLNKQYRDLKEGVPATVSALKLLGDAMTAAAGKGGTEAITKTKDALADLIQKEREESEELATTSGKLDEHAQKLAALKLAYEREVDAIHKAAKATKNYKEETEALSLAFENYQTKIRQYLEGAAKGEAEFAEELEQETLKMQGAAPAYIEFLARLFEIQQKYGDTDKAVQLATLALEKYNLAVLASAYDASNLALQTNAMTNALLAGAGGPPGLAATEHLQLMGLALHDATLQAANFSPFPLKVGVGLERMAHGFREVIGPPHGVQGLKQGLRDLVSGYDITILAIERFINEHKKLKEAVTGVDEALHNMSFDLGNLGGYSDRAVRHIQQLVQAAQQLAAAADTGDPSKMIAAQVQVGLSLIQSYKARAIIESIYYAAKAVAAFAGGDFWQGALYAESSALFALAAGQAKHTTPGAGGGGGAGAGGAGGGGGGGGQAGGIFTAGASGSPGAGTAAAAPSGSVKVIVIPAAPHEASQHIINLLNTGQQLFGQRLVASQAKITSTVGQGGSR
jgi:uncharacterized protein YukE